ncbi:MAG: CinA family protein [Candidatus Omnitrophica bacterium]|nr:CinA family protein [Candidatus Omnitrophota bacterium]
MKRLPLFFSLAKRTVSCLIRGRLTVSIAESCTGGRLSDTLTNIPGSSACFMGAVVAYSNEAKIKLLDVPKKKIEKYGAVSEEAAALMAENIRKKIKSDIGLSVTGIAGPGGGTVKKPVGLVYFGLAFKNNKVHVKKHLFKGSREKIKEQAVRYALEWLLQSIGS